MSSLSTDAVKGAMSGILRTNFRMRGPPLAYGYKASCLTESGGEIYVSTGLQSPIAGLAMIRGSTNSASLKWGTHSLLQWVRGTGSYAVFRAYRLSQLNNTEVQVQWCSTSYTAINWLVWEK